MTEGLRKAFFTDCNGLALECLQNPCKDMHTHAYTSLDQLVRNADQLVTAKKGIEGVHHGASVGIMTHHDSP